MSDSRTSDPNHCPKCGCESVACACGYTDEIRGRVPELVDDEDAYCEHGLHYSVECGECQDDVDEEQYREERGL